MTVEQVYDAIVARKAIYQMKRDAADPLCDDDCNKHERMQHTVEAFDNLLAEIDAIRAGSTGDKE